MKKTYTNYALILLALLVNAVPCFAQMDTMMKVIAIKESAENPYEHRTQYQFTHDAWIEVSDMPWSYVLAHPDWADVHAEAERACARRIVLIADQLRKAGRDVNPYAIAYCWRGGVTAYLKRPLNPVYHRYATEASNLFFHYEKGFVTNASGYAFCTKHEYVDESG